MLPDLHRRWQTQSLRARSRYSVVSLHSVARSFRHSASKATRVILSCPYTIHLRDIHEDVIQKDCTIYTTLQSVYFYFYEFRCAIARNFMITNVRDASTSKYTVRPHATRTIGDTPRRFFCGTLRRQWGQLFVCANERYSGLAFSSFCTTVQRARIYKQRSLTA